MALDPAGILVTFKLSLGVGALVWAWHDGHTPALRGGSRRWLVDRSQSPGLDAADLRRKGLVGLATVALFLPFARLACAPIALAANRHR
jgi:hypothetical protein